MEQIKENRYKVNVNKLKMTKEVNRNYWDLEQKKEYRD